MTESFISAVVAAASVPPGAAAGTSSRLETDFESHWPDPLVHLPPRGEEPSDRPVEAYTPDERRQDVFEGYTFIFYERKQYDNLFPAITSGKGKALFEEVTPGSTQVDDFIRYVKGVAGEKGLGSFDDGSEGRGVVVVRYTPGPKGADVEWYIDFLNTFAQRLDHRPIDQREFLEAILSCDASMLRRPLEEDNEVPTSTQELPAVPVPRDDMELDRDVSSEQLSAPQVEQEASTAQRRGEQSKRVEKADFVDLPSTRMRMRSRCMKTPSPWPLLLLAGMLEIPRRSMTVFLFLRILPTPTVLRSKTRHRTRGVPSGNGLTMTLPHSWMKSRLPQQL